MEHIDGCILFHRLLHIHKSRKQKFVEILIRHVVIFDFSSSLLNIYIVWRIRQNQICFSFLHQGIVGFRQNRITADHTMLSEQPHIAAFRHGRLCKLCVHIKVIFFDFFVMYGIKKLLDLRRFKSGKTNIKIGIFKVFNQICQQLLVPFSGDLIERNV